MWAYNEIVWELLAYRAAPQPENSDTRGSWYAAVSDWRQHRQRLDSNQEMLRCIKPSIELNSIHHVLGRKGKARMWGP
jgi:hypothetical protein